MVEYAVGALGLTYGQKTGPGRRTLEGVTSGCQKQGSSRRNNQRCSRVMTRPAGGILRCSKCDGSGRVGSGQEVVRWDQDVFKSRGSGQVGQEVMKRSRVGSGNGPRKTTHSRVGPKKKMDRELFSVDPRVGPAHPSRGTDTSKTSRFLLKGFSRTNTQSR